MTALAITGCSDDSGDMPEPAPEPAATVERAVLVYMTAHNNLGYQNPQDGDSSHFDERDLAEMTEAARAAHSAPTVCSCSTPRGRAKPFSKRLRPKDSKLLKAMAKPSTPPKALQWSV